jgi:hypothetical protein
MPVRLALGWMHGLCLLTLVLPPSLISPVAPASAQVIEPQPTQPPPAYAGTIERLSRAFDAEAAAVGLSRMGAPQTQVVDSTIAKGILLAVTSVAGAPLPQRGTPNFFWRRTTVVRVSEDSPDIVGESEVRVAYSPPLVTLTMIDRFTAGIDRVAGRATSLAGAEVRRTAQFESDNLEALAAEQLGGGAALDPQERTADLRLQLHADNYREAVTVVTADGSEHTYPDGGFDAKQLLAAGSGGGAALTIGCVSDCFASNGGPIGLATAVCLVAGLVVCSVACGVSAGIACIPCIGGAGTICGVAIAAGALAGCIAHCINPSYVAPTPTQTPLATVFSLSTEPLAAAVGYDVQVHWSAPAGHGSTDYVGLYAVGADNHDYLAYKYLSTSTAGELIFAAPSPPGRYEFRILLDDNYAEPIPPEHAPLLVGSYSLSLERPVVAPGRSFSVDWTAPSDHSEYDWIGIFPLRFPNYGYLSYQYLTKDNLGTFSFTAPTTPGAYELRVLIDGGFTEPGPVARALVMSASCPIGDCDGDGQVTVEELMRMVAGRVGSPDVEPCGAMDADGDGSIAVTEITAAVGYALTGCGDGRACNGVRQCERYQVCDVRDPTCSSAAGMCEPQPVACSLNFDPVCGCDGVTYSNDCLRLMAGAPLERVGACP